MYEQHTTRDNKTTLICQMADGHLVNTIKLHCKRMADARAFVSTPAVFDPITQALTGVTDEAVRKKAITVIQESHKHLYPYVMEASLRGLPVTSFLQEAYGRKEAMPLLVGFQSSNFDCIEPGEDDEDYSDFE